MCMRFLFKKISKLVAIRLKTLTGVTNVEMLLFCFSIVNDKFLCLPDATVVLRVLCFFGETACYSGSGMGLKPSCMT